MNKSSQLRSALAGSGPVSVIGAHDGLGARLAEEAGFDAVWASGLEISAAAAVPDANILTMTQFLDAAVQMDSACRLPVLADCDTGFGNSNNVIHMVKSYEAAGIAGVCIEDKLFPKVNSFVPGRQDLASPAEFVGKILAAKSAQRGAEFLVVARTEALIAGRGLDEALRRAEAYRRAGADAILIHSKQKEPDEILAFLERWQRRSPLVVVPTTYPQLTAREWKAAGADMVIYANHGLRASIAAMAEVFAEIRAADGTRTIEHRIAPMKRVFELSGMTSMKEAEERFLRTGDKTARVIIPAGGDIDPPEDLAALLRGSGPRALLDLYGKRLVERQLEAFASLGVRDVTLVGPFAPEQVPVKGLTVTTSRSASLLGTVLAGLQSGDTDDLDATLVCYSDLLFSPRVARTLLDCDAEIAVLVDASFREGGRERRKRLDFVVTDDPAPRGGRVLDPGRPRRLLNIGKHIAQPEAHAEFIGMLSLGPAGRRVVLDLCAERARDGSRPFGQAASFSDATLTDLLQELVDAGHDVVAVEQDRGWMEIHDFEDYRSAIEQLSRE